MDEKYSERKIVLENNDVLIDDTDFEESSIDEFEDIASLIESNSSYSNDFISDVNQDELVEPQAIEEDQESIADEIPEEETFEVENEDDDLDVSALESQNSSIKLDLFLKYCVDEYFLYNFLRYKLVDADGDRDTLINRIISSFDLNTVMNYRYKYGTSELGNVFDSFIKPLKVVDFLHIADKYDVKVSLSKDALKNNFIEKFEPYELILILNDEGLNIADYLKISVLEQIYLLSDEKLEKEIDKCPNIEKSRRDMISCVVKDFSEGFLISNNKFERGGGAG